MAKTTKKPPQEKSVGQNENKKSFERRMEQVRKILDLNRKGLDTFAIASKTRVAESYVAEVIAKGEDKMDGELRAAYKIPEKGSEPEPDEPAKPPTETKEERKERLAKEKEDKKAAKEKTKAKKSTEARPPKEKRTRENALLKALEESNGTGLTLEAVGARANEILSIDRKSWTGTLGAMKRANEITYNKETKLYNLP